MRKNVQAWGQEISGNVYIDNINLNFLARTASYPEWAGESRDPEGRTMSLAIVLGGWVAASLLLSPLIGRFLSAQDDGEGRSNPHQMPSRSLSSTRLRNSAAATVRRNTAIQLSRRQAGWPRMG